MTKITELQPQQKNANKHKEHGERLLRKSVQNYGLADGITVAANDEAISGSLRIETLADMMPDVKIQVVETYGDTLLVNKRMDIPTPDTKQGRALSVASNQAAFTDYNPDGDILKEWANEDKDIRAMFADSEWAEVTGDYGGSVFVLGGSDVVGKDEGRSGASPWDRVIPSDRVRCLIGDIEFGISKDAYNVFLGTVCNKDNTVREEAQQWLESVITS